MAETNGAEFHRAVSIVRAGGNFVAIFIGHNEVELALLQIAAGQNLGGFGGNLDISARRCRVGVYKLCTANGFAVQRINGGVCHKLTFAVIFDGESDLVCTGIIPDAAEVVIHLADDIGLLAYVALLEIQGKRNFAVCLVRGGFNNPAVFTQIEREVVLVQCACADLDIQFLGGVQSYLNAACGIGVGKLDTIRVGTIFRNGVTCHCQLAAAVVRDGNGHMVGRAVIRNTCNLILVIGGDNLGDVVHILTGFIEGDPSEVKVGSRSVVASLTRHYALGIAFAISLGGQRGAIGDSLQLEGKFIGCLPITALQNLFALEGVIRIMVLRVHGNRGGVIGVCHRDFLGCTCRDRALAVVRDATGIVGGRGFFRDGIGAARGQAHNLGSLAVFQGEFSAALDGFGIRITGNGILVLGIGVQGFALFGCQLKLHRKFGVSVRVQTLVGFHLLGNFQAAGGVHGQLTVVAKVQHTLVCVKVPLEVNAAVGSVGSVARSTIFLFLIAQLVINGGGQAAFFDALLDVALAIFCFNALFDFVLSCNANGHIVGLGNRLSTITGIKLQVVQLIVIGLSRLYHCGRRISAFTGVQQGILGVIVEAVACCRGKGGSGQADGSFCAVCRCCCFASVKFVGVEVDFAVFGVLRNIGGKGGVGNAAGRNLLARIFIKADRVDDADGLGVVDYQLGGAIGACGLIIPQGQHTGRDLDPHVVAVTAVAMGDGDNDILQIGGIGVGVADRAAVTRKGIGIHSWGLVYGFVPKDLFGKGNGLKVFDFHVIAQGIIESHIAFFLGFVRNLRGACRCGRYRREDVLKDILQPISAGSRHIVICLVRSVAEVPFPLQGAFRSRVSGRGVVAGDRLHEFVFI